LQSTQSDLEKLREEQRLQQRQFQQTEFDLKNQVIANFSKFPYLYLTMQLVRLLQCSWLGYRNAAG